MVPTPFSLSLDNSLLTACSLDCTASQLFLVLIVSLRLVSTSGVILQVPINELTLKGFTFIERDAAVVS